MFTANFFSMFTVLPIIGLLLSFFYSVLHFLSYRYVIFFLSHRRDTFPLFISLSFSPCFSVFVFHHSFFHSFLPSSFLPSYLPFSFSLTFLLASFLPSLLPSFLFFLPSFLPTLLLFLLFFDAIGIALDDLKWATITQFKGHYNASHPLVIQNIRENRTTVPNSNNNFDIDSKYSSYNDNNQKNIPITQEEFWKAVPKYPNDGVLLIDVQKYNKMNVLSTVDALAAANGKGEYAVGTYCTCCLFLLFFLKLKFYSSESKEIKICKFLFSKMIKKYYFEKLIHSSRQNYSIIILICLI